MIDVADKQGFMASQHIALNRKTTEPGSTAAAEDVDKRERDVGVVATDRLVQVGKNGQNLVMVAGLVNKAPWSLIAARDVADFGALKGKPVGYTDEKSAQAAVLEADHEGAVDLGERQPVDSVPGRWSGRRGGRQWDGRSVIGGPGPNRVAAGERLQGAD